jgi:molybdenum cofactor synthesis domain-containing protein
MTYRTAVVVLSDSRSAGEREDHVIPACAESLKAPVFEIVDSRVISDDRDGIVAALRELAGRDDVDLIVTSGGTGLGPRDNTPEATRAVITREAPGFAELLRLRGLTHTPKAMLSRGVAGTASGTLIINLPGSPRAVREGLDVLLPILPHALDTLRGQGGECAREPGAAGGK